MEPVSNTETPPWLIMLHPFQIIRSWSVSNSINSCHLKIYLLKYYIRYMMDIVIKYNLYKHKIFFYCKDNQTLEQVPWKVFGFSMQRVNQVSVEHSSEQPAIVDLEDLHRSCPSLPLILYLQRACWDFDRLGLSMPVCILKCIFMTKFQVPVRGL